MYLFIQNRVNDCVLKVNNIDLTNVEYRTAVQAISRGEVVNMVSVEVIYFRHKGNKNLFEKSGV